MKPSDNEIEMLAAGFAIQHKNGLIRFAHALLEKYASTRASTVAGEALTAEAVERQYRDGVHIGSGLPRATCPCGFCAKHRHGFERGDDLAAPQASADVRNAALEEAAAVAKRISDKYAFGLSSIESSTADEIEREILALKTQADKDGGGDA